MNGVDQEADRAAGDRRDLRGRGLRHGVSLSGAADVVVLCRVVADSRRTRTVAASRRPRTPLEIAVPPSSERRLSRAFRRFQNPASSAQTADDLVDLAPECVDVVGRRVGRPEDVGVGAYGERRDARHGERRDDGSRLLGAGATRGQSGAVVDGAVGELVPAAADAVGGARGRAARPALGGLPGADHDERRQQEGEDRERDARR